jgi:hypothetical protein
MEGATAAAEAPLLDAGPIADFASPDTEPINARAVISQLQDGLRNVKRLG